MVKRDCPWDKYIIGGKDFAVGDFCLHHFPGSWSLFVIDKIIHINDINMLANISIYDSKTMKSSIVPIKLWQGFTFSIKILYKIDPLIKSIIDVTL